MSTPRQRSHKGCWTCKRRRRKCGEERPFCKSCLDNGLDCEGYENRLRWDTGIASRGHLTGAKEPVHEKAPPRQQGRLRDLLKQRREQSKKSSDLPTEPNPPVNATPYGMGGVDPLGLDNMQVDDTSARELERQILFEQFLSSGYLSLYAARLEDSPLVPILPGLCEQSETLYNICIALQAYLSHGSTGNFHEYYDVALTRFRVDLDDPLEQTSVSMLMAALLLCTIGMLQGSPWTIHLKGMEKILRARLQNPSLTELTASTIEAIEVGGIMDLPTFVVGRQSPSLGIWRQFRSGKFGSQPNTLDAIEPMSGLPRSLIDVFSANEDELSDENFWLWPGFRGNLLQCHLWEAYRLAGMLDVRRLRSERHQSSPQVSHSTSASPRLPGGFRLPDNGIIVVRLLSALDAIKNSASRSGEAGLLVMNAIFYPLFIVSLEVLPSENYQNWHGVVREWFQSETIRTPSTTLELAWDVLQEVCRERAAGITITADEVARNRGLEIGLL